MVNINDTLEKIRQMQQKRKLRTEIILQNQQDSQVINPLKDNNININNNPSESSQLNNLQKLSNNPYFNTDLQQNKQLEQVLNTNQQQQSQPIENIDMLQRLRGSNQQAMQPQQSMELPVNNNSKKQEVNAIKSTGNKDIDSAVVNASKKYGLDENIIRAVMSAESGGKVNAKSGKGASGLMQLMPETAKSLGVTDIYDVNQNVEAGAKYLKQQLDKFGSLELALAAYNAGPGNVNKYGGIPPFKETQNYVKKIMSKLGR